MVKTPRKRIRYKTTKPQLVKAVMCNKTPALSFNSGSITLGDETVNNGEYWKYLDYVTQQQN